MRICNAPLGCEEELLALQKLCYQENAARYQSYAIAPLLETAKELKKTMQADTILVAMEQRRIIGSIRAKVEGDTCLIGRLMVHPGKQNHRIGSRLLQEMEQRITTTRRFELFTGNRDEKNLYFYKKHGYREFKTERVDEELVLIFLEKHLNRYRFPTE